MSLAAVLTIALSTGLLTSAITAFFSMRSQTAQNLEQNHVHLLDSAQVAYELERFLVCIEETSQILHHPSQYRAQARELLNRCEHAYAEHLLRDAKQLATDGHFAAAIQQAHQVPNSALSREAHDWVEYWSERILAIATDYYRHPTNRLADAIGVASAIPDVSPIHAKAQARIQQWQMEEQHNQEQWQAAREALSAGNLSVAQRAIEQLSDRPAWQDDKQRLQQDLGRKQLERRYHQTLQTAEQLLVQKEPENAIALAQQVPDSYPWGERRHQIIKRAEAMQRRQGACQLFTLGFASCR